MIAVYDSTRIHAWQRPGLIRFFVIHNHDDQVVQQSDNAMAYVIDIKRILKTSTVSWTKNYGNFLLTISIKREYTKAGLEYMYVIMKCAY